MTNPMQIPHIQNVIKDEQKDITFVVMAFRKLTGQETLTIVNNFLALNRKKRFKKHSTITIQWLA